MIRILLVDDYFRIRRLVRILLESETDFTVVGEAGNGEEAIILAATLQPDVLISDLSMPGLLGTEVARQTAEISPQTRTIILSGHIAETYVCDALDAGAMGYVVKESIADSLVNAVREVMAGHRYLSPPLSKTRIESYRRRAQPLKSSERIDAS